MSTGLDERDRAQGDAEEDRRDYDQAQQYYDREFNSIVSPENYSKDGASPHELERQEEAAGTPDTTVDKTVHPTRSSHATEAAGVAAGLAAAEVGKESFFNAAADSTKSGGVRGWIGKNRKKSIAGVLISFLLGGGLIGIGGPSLGVLELIHYAKVLEHSFSIQDDANQGRMGKLLRWARSGDIGETRLSYLESKFMLPNIKAKLADQGIKINTDKTGRMSVIEITKDNPTYGHMSNEEAKAAIAADNGIDPSKIHGDIENNSLKFSARDMNITAQRSFIRQAVETPSKISSWMRMRVMDRYLAIPSWLHPIQRLSAEMDKRFSDRVARPSAIKDYIKERTQKLTAKTPEVKAKLAEFKGKLDVKGKLASGVLIATAAVCVARDVAKEIPEVNYMNVVIPAMASAGDAIALGEQAMSGQDIDMNQVGAIVSNFTDETGKSVWQSMPIEAMQGDAGGEDVDPSVRQAFSPTSQSANIVKTMDAYGAGAMCSWWGQALQGIAGVVMLAAGPGGWALKTTIGVGSAAAFTLVIKGINDLAVKLLADKPITGTPHMGPQGGGVDAYGARALANSTARSEGATALSDTEASALNARQNAVATASFQNESLAYRLFDPYDYRSLTGRIVDEQSPDMARNIASLATGLPRIGGSLMNTLASMFSPHASAANVPYNYGFPQYVISQDVLTTQQNALIDDPYANADAVAKILDTEKDKYQDRALACFGVTFTHTTDGSGRALWDAVAAQDPSKYVNPNGSDYVEANCNDNSDPNWLRIRYFIWDTSLMEGYACYLGDDQSCQNENMETGTSANTPSGTTGGTTIDTSTLYQSSVGIPCASGTTDLGNATGYAAGSPVQIHLCGIPDLPSSSEESTNGSSYYVQGSNGDAIVNARVSGAFLSLVTAAKAAGIPMHANSSFRTMAHQQELCNDNSPCRNGSYTYVAKPGTSNHQMGLAIDFTMADTSKFPDSSASCESVSGRCEAPGDQVWEWLNSNANSYGIKPYANEYWHWSPTGN